MKVVMLTVKELVEARLYPDETSALQDALRHLLRARPDVRIQLAVHRYQSDELSLAQAATIAGVSWPHMRDILNERGVALRLGPETLDEAETEVQATRTIPHRL
jgi:predicted HTH domain antitoxin